MKRFTAKKERCEYAEKGSPGYGVEKRDLVPVALVMVCSVRSKKAVENDWLILEASLANVFCLYVSYEKRFHMVSLII